MRVLVIVEVNEKHRAWLEAAAPEAEFIYKPDASREDVEQADVILGNPSPRDIKPTDKLQWMQTQSAGVDGYLDGCLPENAVLTNATGAYGLAISEYMLTVWLELLKKLHTYRDVQRETRLLPVTG